jgi:Asp-tRNA(Asn)/Glu-tRNA(Gln) amidotransferase A subunit family amidase
LRTFGARQGVAGCAALGIAVFLSVQPTGQSPGATPAARFSVFEKSISELQGALQSGAVTSAALIDQYFARIAAYDQAGPRINAFITLNTSARATAAALDEERRARGARGPLHGIPIVVKDNYVTADMPTTAASKALEGFLSGHDAFVVKKLRDAGAIVVGKTNLHELAYGITSISSMGGQTRNPYDPTRNPGGSSGGTGAAVAANFGAAGLGTDTCGSIRNPSAANNLFGIRPTSGLISRHGIVPLASTQDTGGPLARTVSDLAILLDVMAGPDAGDPATRASEGRRPKSYQAALSAGSLTAIRIGTVPALFGNAPEDGEVTAVVRRALESLRRIGAEVVDVTFPAFETLTAGTSTINAEFKHDLNAFLAQYPKAPVHTLEEIIASGKYDRAVETVLKRANAVETRDTPAYRESLTRREAARETILGMLKDQKLTALAYPTLRRKAAVIGQGQGGSNCQLSATTGLPAMSVPAGLTDDGVPVGMELLGGAFDEATLLRVALEYERVARPRVPPPSTPPLP